MRRRREQRSIHKTSSKISNRLKQNLTNGKSDNDKIAEQSVMFANGHGSKKHN